MTPRVTKSKTVQFSGSFSPLVGLNAILLGYFTACWDRLWLYPEGDPGHDDNETSGDIGVEQVVAQPPLEHEHHLQTREVAFYNYGRLTVTKEVNYVVIT